MTDPIADMIIQIKNAGRAHKETVTLTHSKVKAAILDCLAQAGFIAGVTKKGKKVVKYLEVTLAYEADGQPKISEVKRVSKTSKRVYMKAKEIRPVRSGYGVMVLSTPGGIMTGEAARKAAVGGEVLFTAW